MTVKELIEVLSKLPLDAEVYVNAYDGGAPVECGEARIFEGKVYLDEDPPVAQEHVL